MSERWDESNPEWWKAQLEDRPEPHRYQWLVSEWSAAPADSAEALLRDLVECVNALENRAIRSVGEFEVWVEERMVTESRDRAAAFLAAPQTDRSTRQPRQRPIHSDCETCDRLRAEDRAAAEQAAPVEEGSE
jgi:hypothetical protein